MEGYASVRCLFCETGKEDRVVATVQEDSSDRAIFARRVRFIKRNGEWVATAIPLFPGYVFVYSEREEASNSRFRRIPNVIRVLTYEDGVDRLTGGDLEFADWLWRVNGRIDVIRAAQVGDRVEIADSALKEMHGRILKLNKRQRKMLIALETQSIPMQVWLSYELIERIDEGTPDRADR